MTTDLPDPHACPHCGFAGLAVKWGETICGMCNAPRATATPGCPVRNAMVDAQMRTIDEAHRRLGPNHKDGCKGTDSYLSGKGYNRVRVCACGAEDHEPDPAVFGDLFKLAEELPRIEETGFDKLVADATRIMESAQARCESVIDETFEQSAEAVAKEHSEALRMLAESDKLVEEVFGPCITTETARERKVHGGGPRVVNR